jgi:hypothetical protein
LLVAETGTSVGFKNSQQLFDWCWANKVPIIPGQIERNWLYNGGVLPDKDTYSEQFDSRERYDELIRQSCLGY